VYKLVRERLGVQSTWHGVDLVFYEMVHVHQSVSTFRGVSLSTESLLHHYLFNFNAHGMVIETPPDLVSCIKDEGIVVTRLSTPVVDHYCVEVVRKLAVISECILYLVL